MILFGDRVVCSTGDLVSAARCEFALLRALDAELGLVAPIGSGPAVPPSRTEDAGLPAELRARLGTEPIDIAPPRSGTPAETVAALAAAHEQTLTALRGGAEAVATPTLFDGSFFASCAAVVRTDVLARGGNVNRTDRSATSSGVDPAMAPPVSSIIDGDALRASVDALTRTAVLAANAPRQHIDRPTAAEETIIADPATTEPDETVITADTTDPAEVIGHAADTDSPSGVRSRAADGRVSRGEGGYTLCAVDAESTPIATLIELAACADILRHNGIRVDDRVLIWRPDGAEEFELGDAAVVQAARRRRVAAVLEAKQDELLPVQWGDRRYLACGRCATCTAELTVGRDLRLVAGMRPAVRAQLRDAGITTVDRLAKADAAVTGVAAHVFSVLRRQAELQLHRERTGEPVHVVTDAAALGALPAPSAGDVFLATGGSPVDVVGVGVPPAHPSDDADDPAILFHAFDIHRDPAALLEYLVDRQERHPDLRIYHYRAPTRELLAQLCAQCGADDDIADDLIGALVDLYPIVRSAVMIGERSYGLTELVTVLGTGPGAEDDALEADCAHTLRLRDRLRALAAEHRVRPAPAARDIAPESPSAVEAALREFAYDRELSGDLRTAAREAAAQMGAVLGYHRRERRPLYWAHTDRLHRPITEWADTPGVLVADWGTVDTKWHSPGEGPMRRYLKLTGRLGTGGAPPPGTPVLTLYDRPVPGMVAAPGRRAVARATILGCSQDDNFDDTVRVQELLPDGCAPYDELPVAIVPGPPDDDENVSAALEFAAHQLLVSLPEIPGTAVFDLLCRRPPRLRSAAALPEVFGDHAAAVTAAVLDLDNSYVAVQGPSGTGKNDASARVIERLVTRYRWRVGVVAQLHAAVEEVLDAVVRVGVLPELVAKSEVRAVAPEWLAIDPARYPRFLDNAVNGCVIGGVPGDFADAERIAPGSLDLLVIADAGHLALADAVAAAGSARNLLLLGDPAPLPGCGAHPEPVHESVLGRLVGDAPTLPREFGYFLDRTWRMHPQLCGPVSRLRYDNRLRSTETVTLARDLEGIPPGVRMIPVEHHGNRTESAEEAREIVRRVRALLGLSWRQGAVTRRLHPHDILVVTPYHAQVARIRTLLSRARIDDVVVGTAERMQGREAAVVLVSLATSAPADAPHGIDALLSRHWLTTAVSRAMWTALVVHSPLLTEYLPENAQQLSDLAAFLELAGSSPTL
ncbi:hypothetical protein GZH49_08390 [Nocardia terpenica]|uniref:bifunctional RecB family nuclease/DEAD/DEAH box helicase n=1 Tax=Nocardia terpenica TaxID=455432 RepID=UPI002FE360FA